jgi:hypothetical protein
MCNGDLERWMNSFLFWVAIVMTCLCIFLAGALLARF